MKSLLIVSTALLSAAFYAQDIASSDTGIANANIIYRHNDPVIAKDNSDILLGELNEKSKKGQAITAEGKIAYYFENNTTEKNLYLKSMLFKVEKVRYKTEARIRLYEKHDYVQDVYDPETGEKSSYDSFIPGEPIAGKEIVVYLEPGQNGIVEVDLTTYGITMPAEGLFLSLEGIGYYDAKGNSIKNLDSKELTWVDFHPTTTDNYCSWIAAQGSDNYFWINNNKWLKSDYKFFKTDVPKKTLKAPNFGLKLEKRN